MSSNKSKVELGGEDALQPTLPLKGKQAEVNSTIFLHFLAMLGLKNQCVIPSKGAPAPIQHSHHPEPDKGSHVTTSPSD
jgi:hypothetical protein